MNVQNISVPYLKDPPKKVYTLVLDLDETLIHYNEDLQVKRFGQTQMVDIVFNVRPHARDFLKEMSKYYELVIFTAADQHYADEVINRLDATKAITHRLYRQHVTHI